MHVTFTTKAEANYVLDVKRNCTSNNLVMSCALSKFNKKLFQFHMDKLINKRHSHPILTPISVVRAGKNDGNEVMVALIVSVNKTNKKDVKGHIINGETSIVSFRSCVCK